MLHSLVLLNKFVHQFQGWRSLYLQKVQLQIPHYFRISDEKDDSMSFLDAKFKHLEVRQVNKLTDIQF